MKWFLLLVAILGVAGCHQKTASTKPDDPHRDQVTPKQTQPTSAKSWWSDPKNQETGKLVATLGGKVLKSQYGQNVLKKAGAMIAAVCAAIGVFSKSIFGGAKEAVKAGMATYKNVTDAMT